MTTNDKNAAYQIAYDAQHKGTGISSGQLEIIIAALTPDAKDETGANAIIAYRIECKNGSNYYYEPAYASYLLKNSKEFEGAVVTPLYASQPQAVAEPIEGLDEALEALYGDANLIALNKSPRMAILFEAARRYHATPPAKDTSSEGLDREEEIYNILYDMWIAPRHKMREAAQKISALSRRGKD